ncbi:MAG: hypothetical protein E6772_10725 [Dysgonomonas sp.]|nr:hypothetical protein [Dysgonomonas sp.]
MKKSFLFLLCCAALNFTSCSDDDDPIPNDDKTTAKEFLEEKKNSTKQEFEVKASELPKTFTFKEGVKITIPEGALLKDRQPITGNFTLEVREMLKPSSIVFSSTNTNLTDGSYLETDGFIYVNVKQNGNYIDAQLAKNITISIPTDKEDGTTTQLWTGTEEAGENENQFAWQALNDNDIIWQEDNGGIGENQDGNMVWAKNNSFEFSFGKLGWCNCDLPWGQGKEFTTVTVELTGNVGKFASYFALDGDTFVLFCGKGYPVLAQLYTKVNETTVKSYDNSMPIGVQGKMIAFSIQNGKFSFASQDITIEKDMKLTLNLKEVTKAELTKQIEALDGYK